MTGQDLWLCVPHEADSNYVANMAKMFRDSLNPNIKIYLEYSNELWNFTNTVAYPWVQNNPIVSSLNSAQKIAYFYKRNFDWWQTIFGNQMSSRIIRVVGCQLTNPWYGQQEMLYLTNNGSGADALAPADYFLTFRQNPNYGYHNYDTLNAWGASATVQQIINLARTNIPSMHQGNLINNQTAAQYGLRYIFYEGGQDLNPQNYAPQLYNPAIYAAQHDTAMYNCYMNEFKFLRDSTTLDLFTHFVDFSTGDVQFLNGAPPWGALESVFQDTSVLSSLKYRALINNIYNCSPPTSSYELDHNNAISIYPNPSDGNFSIMFPSPSEKTVLIIFNLLGQRMYEQKIKPNEKTVHMSCILPDGIYFLQAGEEEKIYETKIIINHEK